MARLVEGIACTVALALLLSVFALLTSCKPAPSPAPISLPPPPTTADLHFPVVVLYPKSYSELFKDANELSSSMNTGVVIALDSDPRLIDSKFNLFTLLHLKTTHGGLWLMAHPVGVTSVSFDLARNPESGLEAARAAIRAQLEKRASLMDLDKRRAKLAKAKTLPAMYDALRDW